MNEQKAVPHIRYKGFEGKWKNLALGKITKFINGRAFKQSELLDYGKYQVLRVGNFYTNNAWYYSNLELPEKYYANKGDLLFTWSATFGPHIWEGNKVIYHYHIWKLELAPFVDKEFVLQLLLRDKDLLTNNTNGSTMIHITKSEMENKEVKIPSDFEQQKIGSLFTKLDKLLDLQQQKIDKLELLKKSILQKLFPKHDAKIPELRFKYFKDNWESKTFKNILNYERPDKYIVKSDNYSNNGIPVLTANKSFILGYIQESNFYDKSLPVIIFDDFTLDCKLVRFPFKIKSSAIKILSPNNFSDIWFDFYLLKATSFIKEGHARHYISIVQNKIINVPRKIEQQKIGNLLSKVDQLIELENKKLHNLQQVKKCLLQNMFVE